MAEKRYRASELLQDINGERLSIVAPEDDAVLRLCERVGFGAVMDSAYRQWRRRDPMGAFLVGTCAGMVRSEAAGTPAVYSKATAMSELIDVGQRMLLRIAAEHVVEAARQWATDVGMRGDWVPGTMLAALASYDAARTLAAESEERTVCCSGWGCGIVINRVEAILGEVNGQPGWFCADCAGPMLNESEGA